MSRSRSLGSAIAFRLVLASGLALPGCGAEPPRWLDLARLGVQVTPPAGEIELEGGRKARIVQRGEQGAQGAQDAQGADLWLATTLLRGDWSAAGAPGRFHARLPFVSVGVPRESGAPYRLASAAETFAYEPDPEAFGRAGSFSTRELELELALAPGAEPPESSELEASLNVQRGGAAGLTLAGRRFSGSGFWVTPGRPATLALELPPDSRLCFGTLVEPVLGSQAARLEPATFRVLLDGVVLFESRQLPDPEGHDGLEGESCAWHALDLPRGGVRRARLAFEVAGGFALTSFLAPMVGPCGREPGR